LSMMGSCIPQPIFLMLSKKVTTVNFSGTGH
jgi:hypothetical protein